MNPYLKVRNVIFKKAKNFKKNYRILNFGNSQNDEQGARNTQKIVTNLNFKNARIGELENWPNDQLHLKINVLLINNRKSENLNFLYRLQFCQPSQSINTICVIFPSWRLC